jgi:hypothetical protein
MTHIDRLHNTTSMLAQVCEVLGSHGINRTEHARCEQHHQDALMKHASISPSAAAINLLAY